MENQELEQFKTEIAKQWFACKQSTKVNAFQADQNAALLRLIEQNRDGKALNNVIKKTSDVREKTLTRLAQFLWEYEGFYMYCINTICHILILNGHDLFDSFKKKYVISMEEIAEVDSSTKLRFLEAHKFGMCKRDPDRKLRNKIAHREYSVSDTGRLEINGKVENIGERLLELLDFSIKAMHILTEFTDEENNSA